MKTKLRTPAEMLKFPKGFYFPNKPPGHRCAWSVRWECFKKSVLPADWCSLEDLTDKELLQELEDVIARTHANATQLFVKGAAERARADHQRADEAAKLQRVSDMAAIREYLRQAREHYPHFIYHPNPPENIAMDARRPGWPES